MAIILALPVSAYCQSVLNFSLLVVNGEQRKAYLKQIEAFEKKHPDIRVNIKAVASEQYKNNIEQWLQSESYSDVMFWFAGERLNWYADKGWVKPIDEAWQQYNWYQRITKSAQTTVMRGGNLYGLPIHYYHWGIYYKPRVFAKYGLKPPTTWEEFIVVCETLKSNGMIPITLGSKEVWPVAGWFDYLNLRLNGLPFHQSLLNGELSYTDPRVVSVFDHWSSLINKGFFIGDHQDMTWRQSLPYLYRDLAGMLLMGNFWTSQIPVHLRDDFSVFRFPKIDLDMPWYEEAPTDVLFIPENVVNYKEAKLFLNFMSQANVQQSLNDAAGMLAPQNNLSHSKDHFIEAGEGILQSALGASQYYDRDSPKPIATEGMQQMQRFMLSPDTLPSVLKRLDELREQSFK
jgi:multiple sugar transport system substrate-binding protein